MSLRTRVLFSMSVQEAGLVFTGIVAMIFLRSSLFRRLLCFHHPRGISECSRVCFHVASSVFRGLFLDVLSGSRI